MCLEIEQTNEGEERKEHESGQEEADREGRHERLQSAKSVMPFEIVKEGTLLRSLVHFPTGGMLRCCE